VTAAARIRAGTSGAVYRPPTSLTGTLSSGPGRRARSGQCHRAPAGRSPGRAAARRL